IMGDYYIDIYLEEEAYDTPVYSINVFGPYLDQTSEFETWSDILDALETELSINDLSSLLPTIDNLSYLTLDNDASYHLIRGETTTHNNQDFIDGYISSLLTLSWVYDDVLSDAVGENIYVISIADNQRLALYI